MRDVTDQEAISGGSVNMRAIGLTEHKGGGDLMIALGVAVLRDAFLSSFSHSRLGCLDRYKICLLRFREDLTVKSY